MVNRKLPPIDTPPDSAADDAERYRAPALDKGLDILELLSATEPGLTQAEIAKALDRSPSEIYRMLDRLVRRGYVNRTRSERYALGLKLFALAHQHAPMRRLVAQAMPGMRRYVQAARQSCHLAVYDRGRVVVVAQLEAPGYWGLSIRVGAQVSLLGTGSGHVLLAFQTRQERAFMLAEYAAEANDTPPASGLEALLAATRARGHEIMPSRQTRGVVNISVPVLGPDGTALAALTTPYIERIDTDSADPDTAAAMLRALAAELSLAEAGAAPG